MRLEDHSILTNRELAWRLREIAKMLARQSFLNAGSAIELEEAAKRLERNPEAY